MVEELRSVRRRGEPAPPAVVAAALTAFMWKDVADAVAEVEFDSLTDEDNLARVRDAGGERRLRFVTADRVLEMAVMENHGGLTGRVDPPLSGRILLRRAQGPAVSAVLDENGQFYFGPLKHGPLSLRPVPDDPGVAGFETEWVTI